MIRYLIPLLYVSTMALAKAPPNPDPTLAPFFHGLKQPDTGMSCCSIADCRPVKIRVHENRLQVFIDKESFTDGPDQWVDVPPSKMLTPRPNPTGEPIACWSELYGIMCFLNGLGI